MQTFEVPSDAEQLVLGGIPLIIITAWASTRREGMKQDGCNHTVAIFTGMDAWNPEIFVTQGVISFRFR